jgi:uncharacterized membrane protein SpoIIM required for sporulation
MDSYGTILQILSVFAAVVAGVIAVRFAWEVVLGLRAKERARYAIHERAIHDVV